MAIFCCAVDAKLQVAFGLYILSSIHFLNNASRLSNHSDTTGVRWTFSPISGAVEHAGKPARLKSSIHALVAPLGLEGAAAVRSSAAFREIACVNDRSTSMFVSER